MNSVSRYLLKSNCMTDNETIKVLLAYILSLVLASMWLRPVHVLV